MSWKINRRDRGKHGIPPKLWDEAAVRLDQLDSGSTNVFGYWFVKVHGAIGAGKTLAKARKRALVAYAKGGR